MSNTADNENWREELRDRLAIEKSARRILGVSESATKDEMKSAWRRESLASHPDKNPGDPNAQRRFVLVNCAYRFLTEGVLPCADLTDQTDKESSEEEPDDGRFRSDSNWGYFAWWHDKFFEGP